MSSNGAQQRPELTANGPSCRVDAVCERLSLIMESERLAKGSNHVAEALAAFAEAGLLDLPSFGVES